MKLPRLCLVFAMAFLPAIGTAAPNGANALATGLDAFGAMANLRLNKCAATIEAAYSDWDYSPTAEKQKELLAVSTECPRQAVSDTEPDLARIKATLKSRPKALSLLKDWYASWLSAIENLPISGRSSDSVTNNLTLLMNKVIVEVRF
jgi:hypothetical protein